MDTLIADIKQYLISSIAQISVVRQLAVVNKEYNALCIPHIFNLNEYYKKRYTHLGFATYLDTHSKEKYTVEMVIDQLYDNIPSRYYHNNDIIISMFAFTNQLEYLKLAQKSGNKINYYAMNCAAYSGSLDCLKYIINGEFIDPNNYVDVYDQALHLSQIHIMEWMYTVHPNKLTNNLQISSFYKVEILE